MVNKKYFRTVINRLLLLVVLLAGSTLFVAPAHAANVTVTNVSHSDAGILNQAVVKGAVYFSLSDAVYALSAETGEILWATSTDGAILSSPSVGKDFVYVSSDDGSVYALNSKTGQVIWVTNVTNTSGAIYSSPTIDKRVIYVSFEDVVYALNAETGENLWTTIIGGAIHSSPSVEKHFVYVSSNDGSVYALNAETGQIIWVTNTGG